MKKPVLTIHQVAMLDFAPRRFPVFEGESWALTIGRVTGLPCPLRFSMSPQKISPGFTRQKPVIRSSEPGKEAFNGVYQSDAQHAQQKAADEFTDWEDDS